MRVALVTHKVIKGDGQGRINYEVAQAALRRNHQVVLIASQIAPELNSYPSASWVPVSVDRWPTELLRHQVFAWRSFRWLRRHGHQLDVVHVNGFITWAAADVNASHFLHSTWHRSPVRVTRLRRDLYGVFQQWLHTALNYGVYQWLYTALNARLERRAYGQAKVVVAVSEGTRDELMKIGIPDERICVITNGVDLQEFYPGTSDRRELGLPEGVPLGIFVGDIRAPRKNLDTVLHALVHVRGLHLAVVGSAAGSPYLRLARQLGLAHRIHFLGYRSDVAQLMRAADLFVFPSRFEELPLVLLEAMASGLPVVTATTAGGDDLVNTECGIVMDDPDDAKALAGALRWLVENPERRNKMSRAARGIATQHSWQRMSEQYLQLYEEVANHKEASNGNLS